MAVTGSYRKCWMCLELTPARLLNAMADGLWWLPDHLVRERQRCGNDNNRHRDSNPTTRFRCTGRTCSCKGLRASFPLFHCFRRASLTPIIIKQMRTNQKASTHRVHLLSSRGFGTRLSGVTLLIALLVTSRSSHAQPQRAMGLDVSYWNRGSSSAIADGITQTAWNTAFSTPNANGFTRQFVWIRATRGGTTGLGQTSGTPSPGGTNETQSARYDDPEFLRTVTRSTTAGLFAGAYHFGRPDVVGNTGTDEADHFIEYAGAYMRPGYLMPIYDFEAGAGGDTLAQVAIDFSNRLFERMQIRPAVYINGNYSSILQGATLSRRDLLAKPVGPTPSVVGPAYPMVWNARYYNQTNGFDPEIIPVQTGTPKNNPSISSLYYGPWDDYGNSDPWSFWQYASVVSIPGISTVDSGVDGNVSHGDLEYVKNYLVPAIWWNDVSGDWSTMTNWNSGQPLSIFNTNDLNNPAAPYLPHVGTGQTTPFTGYAYPAPRLPGTAGSGPSPTWGGHDTVILERPNVNITVTLSSGAYNIRKLYMRETLNIVGGSLTINYNPAYRANNSVDVLHAGPLSAQFSGSVTLSNSGALSVHTLQVDTNRIFTLAGGTLTFNTINLMPHAATPAKILMNGDVTFNGLTNGLGVVKGTGASSPGLIDLSGGTRAFNVGNGASDVDLSLDVPVTNGGLTKNGAGTMRLTGQNTYSSGTTVSAGRLLVNNTSGSGTGGGTVIVNAGVLGGTGTIAGEVTVNNSGVVSPGTSIGTLTLNSIPVFNGTNFMEINRNGGSPLADKIVLTAGTLNYGGTLVVSNAGAALTGGEAFTLFTAPAYAGVFANTLLPSLTAGLNWYTDGLVVDGSVRVNRRPVANPLWFTNVAPAVLEIPIATLTGNATDPDANTLAVTGIDLTTTNGITLTTNAASITYSNLASVIDQFSYTINDGRGGSTAGLVNIVNVAASPSAEFVGVPNVNGGSVLLNFSAVPGWTYYLERSTNLLEWKTIWTNVAPASGVFDYTDNFGDLSEPPPSAFYQLRWQQ